jgi:hypothetical protein
MRPSTMWGFAAGLATGSLAIAAAATIGLMQGQEIPPCESLVIEYAVAQR